MISQKLNQFFIDWLQWATATKVVDTFHFNKNNGLCACLHSYSKGDLDLHNEMIALLEQDFKGNYQFPFDKNMANYWKSKTENNVYKNPKRVAWVRSKIIK